MGDGHQVVVHHVGEVVGGQAVGLDEHVVVQRGAVHLHVAVEQIVKTGLALGGHVLADDVGLARLDAALDLLRGEMQAVLVVFEGLALLLRLRARLVQPLPGAEAVVGAAAPDQFLRIGQVEVAPLRLDVGAVLAAHVRAFVVGKAGGGQRGVDLFHRAGNFALLVGVLDAQDELAAVAAGEQIGVKRRAQAAQVQITGRAGREAGADFHGGKTPLRSDGQNGEAHSARLPQGDVIPPRRPR